MPHTNQTLSHWKQLLLAEGLYLSCLAIWMQGDLWYDEVLSLNLVLGHRTPWELFRDYHIANNHFLSNALEWFWLRMIGMKISSEVLLRLPAILLGMGTVAVAQLGWRKFLGNRTAFLAAVTMACSPVFTAFAWQFRGYSLAMFLSTLAILAYDARSRQPTIRNGLALFALGLAMPLVMPPAAMLPCALALALFGQTGLRGIPQQAGKDRPRRFDLRGACQAAAPSALGALLGTAYYLTLLEQFRAATRESGGWTSAWAVGFHLLLAFTLHLGLLAIPLLRIVRKSQRRESPTPPSIAPEQTWWLLAACACAVVAVLLLPSPVQRSPFPRVFLPLLPAITAAAAWRARDWPWLVGLPERKFWQFLAAVVVLAQLVRVGSDALTAWALDHADEPPQNLLQQYYRGNNGVSANLRELTKLPEEQLGKQLVLAKPHDMPTAWHYWNLYGLPEATKAEELSHLLPANQVSPALMTQYRRQDYDVFILARHEQEAIDWAKNAGVAAAAHVEPVDGPFDHLRLFHVVQP